MKLINRLRITWKAWKATGGWGPLAVIYDEGHEDDPGLEEYYGFFGERDEAVHMFNGLFPEGRPQPLGYNPKLVLVIEKLKGKEAIP